MGSFASIAGAETALAREFGRHVFEIAALSRVYHTMYNYRVWMVEVVGLKLVTHHPVIKPVSAPRRERKFTTQRQACKSRLIT
jgi:hypothetical protein